MALKEVNTREIIRDELKYRDRLIVGLEVAFNRKAEDDARFLRNIHQAVKEYGDISMKRGVELRRAREDIEGLRHRFANIERKANKLYSEYLKERHLKKKRDEKSKQRQQTGRRN